MFARDARVISRFHRDQFGPPLPYPTSCSPRARASAAPLLVLRALLGLEPDVPQRRITLRPVLPDRLGAVTITGLRLGQSRVAVTARGGGATENLPPGWTCGMTAGGTGC